MRQALTYRSITAENKKVNYDENVNSLVRVMMIVVGCFTINAPETISNV